MSYRCLIVDDEYPARKLLEAYVTDHPQLEVVGEAGNATDALALLNEKSVDILLLDVQMPDRNGLALIRSMKHRPQVILTTAYPQYALEGFDLQVADYLLKPFSEERFDQAIQRAINLMGEKATTAPAKSQAETVIDHLMIRADHKTVRVYLKDIIYIEGLREYVSIYTADKRWITLEALKNLEDTLPSDQFARVHRSYIVAKDRVTAMGNAHLELGNKKIPIGKSYREQVQAWFS